MRLRARNGRHAAPLVEWLRPKRHLAVLSGNKFNLWKLNRKMQSVLFLCSNGMSSKRLLFLEVNLLSYFRNDRIWASGILSKLSLIKSYWHLLNEINSRVYQISKRSMQIRGNTRSTNIRAALRRKTWFPNKIKRHLRRLEAVVLKYNNKIHCYLPRPIIRQARVPSLPAPFAGQLLGLRARRFWRQGAVALWLATRRSAWGFWK